MPYTPRWYTLLHAGNPGDLAFYIDSCHGATSVLELGAGIGRITMPLAHEVAHVVALEISAEMAQTLMDGRDRLSTDLKEKITVFRGDMRRFAFHRAFERIIIPYNSLLCLLSEADVLSCLTCCAQHLAPLGQLIFDFYDVPKESITDDAAASDTDEFEFVDTIDDGALRAHVFEKSILTPDPRRFDVRYRYEVFDVAGRDVETFEYDIEQRCLLKEDIPDLLHRAGLRLAKMIGDFGDEPIDDDTLQIAVVATRTPL